MSAAARVVQINISQGGVPKTPIESAEVGPLGISGDRHRYSMHGGPAKALLLLAAEVVDALRQEGWPVFYGALGENLTTQGLDHRSWRSGQLYRVGDTLIELTQPRDPCRTLDRYGRGIQRRIYDKQVAALDPSSKHWGESGFYAAVLQSGIIACTAIIGLVDQVVSPCRPF